MPSSWPRAALRTHPNWYKPVAAHVFRDYTPGDQPLVPARACLCLFCIVPQTHLLELPLWTRGHVGAHVFIGVHVCFAVSGCMRTSIVRYKGCWALAGFTDIGMPDCHCMCGYILSQLPLPTLSTPLLPTLYCVCSTRLRPARRGSLSDLLCLFLIWGCLLRINLSKRSKKQWDRI